MTTERDRRSLQAGDTVILKSGGPPMTVIDVSEEGYAIVTWFEGGELNQRRFRIACIEPTDVYMADTHPSPTI